MTFGARTRAPLRRVTVAALVAPFAIVAFAACSSDGANGDAEPACLDEPADANCTEVLYGLHGGQIAPTFEDVFNGTLKKTCAAAGCHSGSSPQGDLKLDDIDTAYADLLAKNAAGETRVKPGDVQCGKVIVRLESVDKPWSMPPRGGHLKENELCAIRHWIKDGAKR